MPTGSPALAPAPVAGTSGSAPGMKAKDVIRIWRNRAFAGGGDGGFDDAGAVQDALLAGDLDDEDGVHPHQAVRHGH